MLDINGEVCKEIPQGEAYKLSIRMAVFPILGSLFHPVYTVVNAASLGKEDSPEPLAGLGLGSLTMGICVLSIGACFGGGFSTFASQAFGSGDLRLAAVYRNRQFFLNTVLYLIICVPISQIDKIWLAIGQKPEVI